MNLDYLLLLITIIALLLAWWFWSRWRTAVRIHPSIRKSYVISLNAGAIKAHADNATPFALQLGNQPVSVVVTPTPVFSAGAEVIEVGQDQSVKRRAADENVTYAGTVVGADKASDVRLTIAGGTISGYVRAEKDWWFIEPLKKFRAQADPSDYLVYRTKDLRFELKLDDDARPASAGQRGRPGANPPHRVNPVIGIAMVADQDYTAQAAWTSWSWSQHQASLINKVNGIFRSQFNCEFQVRFFVANNNPARLTSTNHNTLLDQLEDLFAFVFGNLRQLTNRQTLGVEVAHLTTGKNLPGSARGTAWQPGVYSLTEQRLVWVGGGGGGGAPNLAYTNLLIAAHEIGHNFDSVHEEADRWCVAHFIGCVDYVRTLDWPAVYDDSVARFSDGSRDASHNNQQRISTNMATGRNQNF